MKYRQKIEQKLSLAARQPTENLCDIDSLDEEVYQDKNPTEIANEVREMTNENGARKKKEKRKKKKNPSATGNNRKGTHMFEEILASSDDE